MKIKIDKKFIWYGVVKNCSCELIVWCFYIISFRVKVCSEL